MLFWLVMIGAAIYAVVLFRRWVNAQTSVAAVTAEESETVSVEEFVE